jgi:hypothetical protein
LLQATVVRLGKKFEWNVLEREGVVSLEVLVTVFDDSVRERLVVGVVNDDAGAAVSQNIPDAVFVAVVDPFGYEGEIVGLQIETAASG